MWRDQALTTGSVQEEGRVCEDSGWLDYEQVERCEKRSETLRRALSSNS